MVISDYITPVMYTDPSGEFLIFALTAIILVMTTVLIVSTSPSAEYISEQPVVLDFSKTVNIIGPLNFKFGLSIVINFKDDYMEFYPHLGPSFGSVGESVSIGTIYNYKEKGDYRKHFIYGEIGYMVGVNHCVDFTNWPLDSSVKATSIVFSSGFIGSVGYDYYIYNKKLIIDWS